MNFNIYPNISDFDFYPTDKLRIVLFGGKKIIFDEDHEYLSDIKQKPLKGSDEPIAHDTNNGMLSLGEARFVGDFTTKQAVVYVDDLNQTLVCHVDLGDPKPRNYATLTLSFSSNPALAVPEYEHNKQMVKIRDAARKRANRQRWLHVGLVAFQITNFAFTTMSYVHKPTFMNLILVMFTGTMALFNTKQALAL
jgi:hypothetical protein